MSSYKIFTDGAFSSSRNQGGCAFAILNEKNRLVLEYYYPFKDTTNNKMEIKAIILALRCIKKEVDSIKIYTDSMYCIGCGTLGWKRNKNVILWKLFDKELERVKGLCKDIEFIHVKGHTKEDSFEAKWNDRVDKLAVKASLLEL